MSEDKINQWDGVDMPARLWAIFAILFGVSLAVIDGVIVNVALPTISLDLGVSASESIWVVNSYQIAIVMSLLTLSGLGDFLGYKRVYLTGVALFVAASLGCALSPNLEMLVVMRVVQGFGSSALMAVNASIVRLIYPRRMLGRGMGINSMVVSVSSVVGPTLAAAILSVASWHWLFLVNVPIGVVTLVLGSRFIPHNPARLGKRPFTWIEALLNALTFGLFFMVATSFSVDVNPFIIGAEIVALVVIGWIYIRSQLRSVDSLLPLELLRIPIFSMSVLTSSLSFVAQMATMVAIPFFMHNRMGASPVDIGVVMTAWPVCNIFTSMAAGFLVEKIHAGVLGGVGLTMLTVALLSFGVLPEDLQNIDLMWRLALCGLGFGLFQSPNNSVIISSAPLQRSGAASGMMASARMVGQTLGAVMVAVLFHLVEENDGGYIMIVAGVFALAATVISFSRLNLPLPESLRRKK